MRPPLTIEIMYYGEDNDTIEVPAKYAVCGQCNGHGVHVNPAIDGHGISEEEMHNLGPDFQEEYIRGDYDVRCYRCDGKRVILVPDTDRMTPSQIKALAEHREEEYSAWLESEAERRAGC